MYKDAYSHEKCVELIAEASGTQFDPEITDVFLEVADRFREIASRFGDHSAAAADDGQAASVRAPMRGAADRMIRSLLEEDASIVTSAGNQ